LLKVSWISSNDLWNDCASLEGVHSVIIAIRLLHPVHCIFVALKGVRESDKRQKESPPIESRGSDQTPLLSKLSLRGESRCGWI